MLFAVIESEPENADPSLIVTEIAERDVPSGLLSGTVAVGGVRSTDFGTAVAVAVAVMAALFAITLKLLLEKKRTSYRPAEDGTAR
jgi:hypothetical protein